MADGVEDWVGEGEDVWVGVGVAVGVGSSASVAVSVGEALSVSVGVTGACSTDSVLVGDVCDDAVSTPMFSSKVSRRT